MARSHFYNRRRGRIRKRTNIIPVLVIIVVAITFIYGRHFFGSNKAETSAALANTDVEKQISSFVPVESTPKLKPNLELKSPEIVPNNTCKPKPEVAQRINEAMAIINTEPSRIIEVRDRLNQMLSIPMNEEQRTTIKQQLSKLADIWLFSRTVFPQDRLCSNYDVKPGDLLTTIGERHRVPWEILKGINKIHSPELLKAGETIKVINGPFHAKIYRSTFTMDLYLQDTFIKSFPVGLGKPGRETPTGLWVVKPGGKLISPPWTDPDTHKRYEAGDPDYPLGSRWIALEGIEGQAKGRIGFAIHGTTKPEQIGTAGSRGCIRLRDNDVVLTYSLLMPGLSKVQVFE
jgi:LysM repeat protein